MSQSDLFSTECCNSNPIEFEITWRAWLEAEQRAGRLQLETSANVYASIWGALSAWCISEQYDLGTIDADGLERFLSSRGDDDDISMRHAWRVLRLVDRVLRHRARRLDIQANLAAAALIEMRPEYRYANAADKDPLPEFLVATEAKTLVTYLSAVRPGRSAAGATWQEVRNRCSVALMLGCGATPGEVRTLKVPDAITDGGRKTGVPWKLRIASHAGSPARETPIAPWAGQLLAHWLQVRLEQDIPGEILLPSTRTGKPWSKVSQYNATAEVLRAAGVDDVAGGSYRLRHTFALRQLKKGRAAAEVGQWLGVVDPGVMARYERVLMSPIDVV